MKLPPDQTALFQDANLLSSGGKWNNTHRSGMFRAGRRSISRKMTPFSSRLFWILWFMTISDSYWAPTPDQELAFGLSGCPAAQTCCGCHRAPRP